jgi:hypothetical protein
MSAHAAAGCEVVLRYRKAVKGLKQEGQTLNVIPLHAQLKSRKANEGLKSPVPDDRLAHWDHHSSSERPLRD